MNIKWDHLAEAQSDRLFAGWLRLLMQASPALPLKLAQQHRPRSRAVEASEFTTGSYNMCCIVTYEDGYRAVVRFPVMGRSRFRVEKTRTEMIVMAFLSKFTRISVPEVLGTGMWTCGPYSVISFVEGTLLSKSIRDPTAISEPTLMRAYAGMAHILIELSIPEFPTIGALGWDAGEWKVTEKRPLSLNMNELTRVGNYPPDKFAESGFRTASEYFQELAAQHFYHLKYQRNDAIKDEQDCRKKYIARCLFKRIAKQISTEPGPFRLYCDDLCPSNVLVSGPNLLITGVIDWEFTYVAPLEFSYTAPWWLLFEAPETYDLNTFLTQYKPRPETFLAVLQVYEDKGIEKRNPKESQRLSKKMAQSLENGLFWFCLAARKSFNV